MRLLVVCQYYRPEPFNVSEVCEELVRRGHEVTVVTGRPNYPEGELYPGYEGGERLDEVIDGVRVLRTRIAPRRTGAVSRFRNYLSFALRGARRVEDAGEAFDAALVFQLSPVMMAVPALAHAMRHGTPVLHYVVDLWPESLLAGGVRRGSAVYRLFAGLSRAIYSRADRLAITSPAFEGYLSDLLGKPVDAAYLPQFAEDAFGELPEPGEDPAFPRERLNVVFAGNVGAAQDVQTLVRAAALLKGEPFRFHVAGSGSELAACRALARELGADVVFHGRLPIDEMPSLYAKADAMAATFADDPVLGFTLPRKVQSYMAAGKPVVGAVTGEAARVLAESGCGLVCPPGDAEGMAARCRELAAAGPGDRALMGEAGRAYCERHYSRGSFFETLEGELLALKGKRHGGGH